MSGFAFRRCAARYAVEGQASTLQRHAVKPLSKCGSVARTEVWWVLSTARLRRRLQTAARGSSSARSIPSAGSSQRLLLCQTSTSCTRSHLRDLPIRVMRLRRALAQCGALASCSIHVRHDGGSRCGDLSCMGCIARKVHAACDAKRTCPHARCVPSFSVGSSRVSRSGLGFRLRVSRSSFLTVF